MKQIKHVNSCNFPWDSEIMLTSGDWLDKWNFLISNIYFIYTFLIYILLYNFSKALIETYLCIKFERNWASCLTPNEKKDKWAKILSKNQNKIPTDSSRFIALNVRLFWSLSFSRNYQLESEVFNSHWFLSAITPKYLNVIQIILN